MERGPEREAREAGGTTRLALYAAAVVAALVIGPRGPVYWDSFGYVRQALTGQVGGLALGRPLFVLTSHVLTIAFQAAGGSVWALEPFLRTAWLALAALAAPLTHALARRCGLGSPGALVAGLAVALSPAMAHTSSAVLTDAPSVAMALLAFVLGAQAVEAGEARVKDGREQGEQAASLEGGARRGQRVTLAAAAGAALGAAFGLREQAVAQGAVLALMVPVAPRGVRAHVAVAMALGFALVAAGPVVFVAATQRGYGHLVAGWVRAMERERAAHPYRVQDLLAYAGWLVALGPAALVAGAVAWVRHGREIARRWTVSLAVAVPSLVQLALLGGYQDISFSPRYLLPALPGALAIPAGMVLERWMAGGRGRSTAVLAALLAPLVLAAPVVRAKERPLRVALEALPAALANVPSRSVVVTGQLCPGVELIEWLARSDPGWRGPRPSWERVCPGWGWPADFAARLDRARAEGRTVVLDLREVSWLGPRQRAALAQVRAYGAQRAGEEGVLVWRE